MSDSEGGAGAEPALLTSRAFWRSRDGLVLALVFALGTAAYVGFTDYHGRSGGVAELDGYYYYIYLRSVQVDGDLDFANEYRQWGNPFGFGRTTTGRARNVFGVGPALLWSPFFALACGLAALGRALGYPISPDGLSRFHQVITLYGSLVYGWLALLFCYLVVRRWFSRRHALWAALGAALAGPLPFYCLTGASYSHAPAAFATSLLLWAWLRHRDDASRRSWLLLGATSGLALLVRPAALPFMLIPLWEALRLLLPLLRRRELSALPRALLDPTLGGLMALAVFSPQLWVWKLLYGSALLVPQGRGFLLWGESAWLQTLFAPRNGLLPSAPLYALALGALLWTLRSIERARSLPLLAVFVGLLLLNGAVHDWWGWNFSARRFTLALPIFAIGLTYALVGLTRALSRDAGRTIARLCAAVVALAVLFNIEWMRQYGEKNLKWYSVRSTQGIYLTVAHGLVDRVYRTVGNPLSLPATLLFNARRGGSPRTYDRIEGSYLLGETNPETLPAGKPFLHAMMPLASDRFRFNLSASFGAARVDGKVPFVPLRDAHGHVFLPLNRPGTLRLWLRARARYPQTRVELRFNGQIVARELKLSTERWTTLAATVPAHLVERGINRLDLVHWLPPAFEQRGNTRIGSTAAPSPVDLAVASGGASAGRFCDVWRAERRQNCGRGINAMVLSATEGRMLGWRTFDAHVHPAAWSELARYLATFPRGSIIALGSRDDVARHFRHGGRQALALLGATTDLAPLSDEGYAAIGVLGAPPGSALESHAAQGHARVHVGRLPPTWREAVWYSAIRLR